MRCLESRRVYFNLLDWRGQHRRRKTRQYFAGLVVLGLCVWLIQAWALTNHQSQLAQAESAVQTKTQTLNALSDELDGLEDQAAASSARQPRWVEDTEALSAIHALTEAREEVWVGIVDVRPEWVWLDRVVQYMAPSHDERTVPTHRVLIHGRGLTPGEVVGYQARLAARLPDLRIELIDQQQNPQGLSDFVMGIGP